MANISSKFKVLMAAKAAPTIANLIFEEKFSSLVQTQLPHIESPLYDQPNLDEFCQHDCSRSYCMCDYSRVSYFKQN